MKSTTVLIATALTALSLSLAPAASGLGCYHGKPAHKPVTWLCHRR